MSDSEQTTDADVDADLDADRKARSAVRAFLAEHGAPTRAVVEPIGHSGARMVLVGVDGAVGALIVPDGPRAAHALVDTVAGLEAAEWVSTPEPARQR